MRAFRYLPDVPEDYRCTGCGAGPVKLWRQYQTVASNVRLLCCVCALADQKKARAEFVDAFGRFIEGDQIGWTVPAVPTEDGETFWGYTSVPEAGVAWWKCLPLDAPASSAAEASSPTESAPESAPHRGD